MPQCRITIIGGGLAGSEAAWQAARRGAEVDLYEMRPVIPTPAHRTGLLAELVCSNSLKSERENSAPWLLKEELRRAGSLLLRLASQCAVPAGQALAVDRERFSAAVSEAIESDPRIRIHRRELREIPGDSVVIIASGPLTSDALAESVQRLTGAERLFFYDSISPIVDAGTIDGSKVFPASRYGRSLREIGARPAEDTAGQQSTEGDGDYLNCPLNDEEYQRFYDAVISAESVALHEFENANYFESCLPIEELARRGRDTLRFGPMKPVGLVDPRTGRRPYAAVQLRRENLRADSYNLVGFQNHLKFGEQKRILRLIPGLETAEFLRYGQIHRNTYINAPALLAPTLQLLAQPRIFFAGQICGVEGYVESIATGLLAGRHAVGLALLGESPLAPPRATALGSLCHYVSHADPRHYQPANIAFDLLPPLCAAAPAKLDRQQRRARQCQIALAKLEQWLAAEEKATA
ncbi:MAG: methylenetetrahydrofolate--tRNA-(uracil(54)-C(5))-methyltransferase (FADH(2)-oxidizing) TrmFO [Acidobacteria bacterium]|nr:methylenetetrahydrofolate--tRNA-(uracil(54)-C(5))-methyltransferase (FADH(2)-oxidizing) TrmFO [Acidobacteriota bacterium]